MEDGFGPDKLLALDFPSAVFESLSCRHGRLPEVVVFAPCLMKLRSYSANDREGGGVNSSRREGSVHLLG
jgi:hypothetical protein